MAHSKQQLMSRTAGAALLAFATGFAPGPAHAIPSVAATPSPDVYTELAQNPGLAASIPLYTAAQAPGTYSSLTVIGDSYADWGNALAFNPVSSQVGADGRYGNALNIIDALQYHYALPTSAVTNYAFGGATTGSVNNNPPALMLPGFAQQIQALVSSGRRFGASDLITFTTEGVGGGNDTPLGISIAQGTANLVGYITTLVGLGARNLLINGEATAGNPALDAATQASVLPALAQFANEGVNIFYFDNAALADTILANPTAYGFAPTATATDYCAQFGGPNVCNAGMANKTALQTTVQILAEDQYLYFYAHPTSSYAALIAQGDVNLLAAGPNVVPEPNSLGLLGLGLVAIAMTAVRRRC